MNLSTLAPFAIAIAAAFVGQPVLANGQGEAQYEYPMVVSSVVDRADVRRQAVDARDAGLIASGEIGIVAEPGRSVLSRTQVRAEALEALRLGLVASGEQTVQASAAQLEAVRQAGLRAVAADTVRMASR